VPGAVVLRKVQLESREKEGEMKMGYLLFAIAIIATALVYSCAAISGQCARKEEAAVLPQRERSRDNRCVLCGVVIPEGTWVCPNCQVCVEVEEDGK
jgi:hypothetical protein